MVLQLSMIVLLGLGLLLATVTTDYLAARWVDARGINRAHIAALHEAVAMTAGFTVFTFTRSAWMILPCVLGAWLGSFLAGGK